MTNREKNVIREIRKYEYIEKEKNFLDEIKSILHGEKKKKEAQVLSELSNFYSS